MVSIQWGIFWADLSPVIGSEQAGKRPVLVVSNEIVNKALPVISILPLTSLKENRVIYPTEILLKREVTGLPVDSIAMGYQIRTIAKQRLGDRCGEISTEGLREEIREALRLYLDL